MVIAVGVLADSAVQEFANVAQKLHSCRVRFFLANVAFIINFNYLASGRQKNVPAVLLWLSRLVALTANSSGWNSTSGAAMHDTDSKICVQLKNTLIQNTNETSRFRPVIVCKYFWARIDGGLASRFFKLKNLVSSETLTIVWVDWRQI